MSKEQKSYNFSSVDLLIYIWKKRLILTVISLVAAIVSLVISFQITPKFKSSVVMFPATGASVSKALLSANYMGKQDAYGFGEEEQAEQLLQVLNSEVIRERIMTKYKLMEHYGIDPAKKYPYTKLNAEYRDNNEGGITHIGSRCSSNRFPVIVSANRPKKGDDR